MILGLAACVLFLGGTIRRDRNLWGIVALTGLAVAFLALMLVPRPTLDEDALRSAVFNSPIFVDRLAVWIAAIAIAGGLVLVLSSWNEVSDEHAAEYHGCLLVIIAGVGISSAANELVTLFLGLELISIPTYVLLYLTRFQEGTQEAAMKYFLLSIFSSALLLFGFSYLYGVTGTTNIPAILAALGSGNNFGLPVVTQIALVTVVAGLGFRITAVPFHFYAPDVYQGTTNSAAALLAFVPKVAGFAVLLRVLGDVPNPLLKVEIGTELGTQVPNLLWILAAATMTVGNVLALLQDNLRRLLAYSSVAHSGYILIALAAIPALWHRGHAPNQISGGVDAIVFYLIAYGAMTVGAFTMLGYLSRSDRPVEKVDDLAGLGSTHPGLALLLMLFLLSLTGIPVTAGFFGKLFVFLSALSVSDTQTTANQARLFQALAVIGVVNAALGGWYYLRVIATMYFRGALKPLPRVVSWTGLAALIICGAVTIAAPWTLWSPAREILPESTVGEGWGKVREK